MKTAVYPLAAALLASAVAVVYKTTGAPDRAGSSAAVSHRPELEYLKAVKRSSRWYILVTARAARRRFAQAQGSSGIDGFGCGVMLFLQNMHMHVRSLCQA